MQEPGLVLHALKLLEKNVLKLGHCFHQAHVPLPLPQHSCPRYANFAPMGSSLTTFAELTSSLPDALKALDMASITLRPVSGLSTMATAVGPAPLMVQPNAPAALAASLTAIMPGMRGPRTGSMMTSESRDCPMSLMSPVKIPVTSDPPWQQLLIMLFMGTSLGSTARISAVGASNTGLTRTKCRSSRWKGSCSSSTGWPGLQLLISTKPPSREGPTLSAW
mmetsp:Transcript_6332/g.13997  ORF Transcript_6332/g.13997 Transcript_6332/m.13997 type:complete len:221 (+) Transcript_6332:467-1129(+)